MGKSERAIRWVIATLGKIIDLQRAGERPVERLPFAGGSFQRRASPRGHILAYYIPRRTGYRSRAASVPDCALDFIARADAYGRAFPYHARCGGVPTGNTPRSGKISVPPQHGLKNTHSVVDVIEARKEIHRLAIIGNRRWRHGPGCGKPAV